MFISMPHHEFDVPPSFAEANAKYWRALTLSTDTPWFLATAHFDGPSEPSRSMLFYWDVDLVHALAECSQSFEALVCFQRNAKAGQGWSQVAISEVWKGQHPNLPEDEAPMFMTVDGDLICGPLARPVQGATLLTFVAKVAPRQSVNSCDT